MTVPDDADIAIAIASVAAVMERAAAWRAPKPGRSFAFLVGIQVGTCRLHNALAIHDERTVQSGEFSNCFKQLLAMNIAIALRVSRTRIQDQLAKVRLDLGFISQHENRPDGSPFASFGG